MWVKLDDRLDEDPDLEALSDAAFRLWVCSLTYCGRNETDGYVTRRRALILAPIDDPETAIAELVAAGRWEATEGGWVVRKFLDYNPSRAELDEKRARDAERQRRHRRRDTPQPSQRDTEGESQRQSQRPDPTRPDPYLPTSPDLLERELSTTGGGRGDVERVLATISDTHRIGKLANPAPLTEAITACLERGHHPQGITAEAAAALPDDCRDAGKVLAARLRKYATTDPERPHPLAAVPYTTAPTEPPPPPADPTPHLAEVRRIIRKEHTR